KLCVISERDIGTMKIPRIRHAVSHAPVDERREVSPSMLDVIRPVPRRVPGAEAFLGVPGWRPQMQRRRIGHRLARKQPPQIRADIPETRTGSRLRIIGLDS